MYDQYKNIKVLSFKVNEIYTWNSDDLDEENSNRPKISFPMFASYADIKIEEIYIEKI